MGNSFGRRGGFDLSEPSWPAGRRWSFGRGRLHGGSRLTHTHTLGTRGLHFEAPVKVGGRQGARAPMVQLLPVRERENVQIAASTQQAVRLGRPARHSPLGQRCPPRWGQKCEPKRARERSQAGSRGEESCRARLDALKRPAEGGASGGMRPIQWSQRVEWRSPPMSGPWLAGSG